MTEWRIRVFGKRLRADPSAVPVRESGEPADRAGAAASGSRRFVGTAESPNSYIFLPAHESWQKARDLKAESRSKIPSK